MSSNRFLRASLGLVLAITLGLARTEKVWASDEVRLPQSEITCGLPSEGTPPFDPRRVPQSGGMASRLLSGITVKHTHI